MTLIINDTRNNQKGILWDSLEAGSVYVDCYGNYVMAIDTGVVIKMVDLSDGLVSDKDAYAGNEEFIPVKAKLEVFA